MPDDDKPNVLSLVPKGDSGDELAAILKSMERNAGPIARIRWAFYKAHVEAGFTPEQALALCQKVTI